MDFMPDELNYINGTGMQQRCMSCQHLKLFHTDVSLREDYTYWDMCCIPDCSCIEFECEAIQ